jgi:hypothetical protein
MPTIHELDARVVVDGVQVLRWPAQEIWRRSLAAAGTPRLLLLDADAPPPEDWDELEDWLRLPLDADELHARARAVRMRARSVARPVLDDEGLCWFEDRWVDLTPSQASLVALLLEHYGEVVPAVDVIAAIEGAGACAGPSALKNALVRLRTRLAAIDLEVRTVRGRGYLLQRAEADGTERSDPEDRA